MFSWKVEAQATWPGARHGVGHGVSSVRTPGAAGEATTARTTARVRTRARIPSEGPLGYNDGERRAGAMNRHGLAGVQFF